MSLTLPDSDLGVDLDAEVACEAGDCARPATVVRKNLHPGTCHWTPTCGPCLDELRGTLRVIDALGDGHRLYCTPHDTQLTPPYIKWRPL
ncbi:MAG: hypothetical protein ACO1ON_12915 [Nocardioides sp.]